MINFNCDSDDDQEENDLPLSYCPSSPKEDPYDVPSKPSLTRHDETIGDIDYCVNSPVYKSQDHEEKDTQIIEEEKEEKCKSNNIFSSGDTIELQERLQRIQNLLNPERVQNMRSHPPEENIQPSSYAYTYPTTLTQPQSIPTNPYFYPTPMSTYPTFYPPYYYMPPLPVLPLPERNNHPIHQQPPRRRNDDRNVVGNFECINCHKKWVSFHPRSNEHASRCNKCGSSIWSKESGQIHRNNTNNNNQENIGHLYGSWSDITSKIKRV